jgi:hypothetical protein
MEMLMSQRKFKRAQEKVKKAKDETASAAGEPPSLQAMVYYREEDWDALMKLFVDADKLPRTYQEWHRKAEKMRTEIEESGDIVLKVFIDPETFPQWCAAKGVPMDGEARSQLAIEVAQARSISLL